MKKKSVKIFVFLSLLLIISLFLDKFVMQLMFLIKNPFLDIIMEWFSNEITVFVILVIISGLFLYQERKTKHIAVLLGSFFTSFLLTYLFKLFFMRPRPLGTIFHSIGFFDYNLKFPDYSFPSAHSSTAFSVLPILDKEFKKIHIFWIIFSVMIAISRIYLNEHYLSDIIAGSILGYMIGYVLLKVEKKHGFGKRFFQKVRV